MTAPGRSSRIRILVADDHPLVRLGLRTLLDTQPDMQVVAEADDGAAAVRLYGEHRPDVTLMDLRMSGLEGAEAIAAILRIDPAARVVVLTTYDGDEDVYRAVRAGARGYLLKDTFPEATLGTIRDVHAGGRMFSPHISAKLARRTATEALNGRERRILELVAKGLTNKEIQVTLSMAEGTLKNHLKRIFEKLDVTDRTAAAMVAIQRGVIRPR